MIFEERKQSILSVIGDYSHIRYISADFVTDKKTRRKLEEQYPNYIEIFPLSVL